MADARDLKSLISNGVWVRVPPALINPKNKMKKKLIKQEELLVQFSEEEIESFGWEKGQKLSIELKDDGVFLSPHKKMDIDISEWSRDVLEMLISKSCEQDISVNEVIEEILDKVLNESNT
jgi:hypothetical protein